MPPIPNDPNVIEHAANGFTVVEIATCLFMSTWGCIVSFLYRWKRGLAKFNWIEFAIEWLISMFAGVIVFILAVGLFGIQPIVAAAFSGLAGHNGARTVVLILRVVNKRAESFLPKEE